MSVSVEDEDLGGDHETVGSVEIELAALIEKKETDQWHELEFEGKSVGKIRFIISWTDAATASPERQSTKKSPYLVKQGTKKSTSKL